MNQNVKVPVTPRAEGQSSAGICREAEAQLRVSQLGLCQGPLPPWRGSAALLREVGLCSPSLSILHLPIINCRRGRKWNREERRAAAREPVELLPS